MAESVFVVFVVFLVLVLAVVPIVLLVYTLVDLVRRPKWVWQQSGQDQLIWALIVLLVGLIGPILYLVIARPKLDAVGLVEPIPPAPMADPQMG